MSEYKYLKKFRLQSSVRFGSTQIELPFNFSVREGEFFKINEKYFKITKFEKNIGIATVESPIYSYLRQGTEIEVYTSLSNETASEYILVKKFRPRYTLTPGGWSIDIPRDIDDIDLSNFVGVSAYGQMKYFKISRFDKEDRELYIEGYLPRVFDNPNEVSLYRLGSSTEETFVKSIERKRTEIPIPLDTEERPNRNWYTDREETTQGKPGYKIDEYEVKTYSNGRREETFIRNLVTYPPVKKIREYGTKPITRYETTYEYEDIPIPEEPTVIIDQDRYADSPDEVTFQGEKGRITKEYRYKYVRDVYTDRELVNTTRKEAKPKIIKRGGKKGEYLWRRLRIEYLDGRVEYKDCKYIPDIQSDLSVIRSQYESLRSQTNKEIREFVKKTDYDINNQKINEELNQVTRTASQTKEEISNVEREIRQEILKSADKYERVISQTKKDIQNEVKDKIEESNYNTLQTKLYLESKIEQSSSQIALEVGQKVSRSEAESIAESKKTSSYEIQREAERVFSRLELTPTQITAVTNQFDIKGKLKAYRGEFGPFLVGEYYGKRGDWITTKNYQTGMGSGGFNRTCLWVNWGNNWDESGKNAWLVNDQGKMYAKGGSDLRGQVLLGYYDTHELYLGQLEYYTSFTSENKLYGLRKTNTVGLMWGGKNNDIYYDYNDRIYSLWDAVKNSSSDRKLKKNIVPTKHNAIPFIERLKFNEYDWIDGKFHAKHTNIGLIAQEVQEVDDTLVYQNGDILKLDTLRLANLALKGIQELSNENKLLTKEVEELKNIIKEMRNEKVNY